MFCNRFVVALAVAAAGLLLSSSQASAETMRFGVAKVQNDTGNLTITFNYKVGDGPWRQYTLGPGKAVIFWHKYARPNEDNSPTLQINFNSAIGNNPSFPITYTLTRYAAPDKLDQYAKTYSFRKNDDNYYDLYSIN